MAPPAVTVELSGRLTEEDAITMEREVWDQLQTAELSLPVLFDLEELEGCQLLARPALIALQTRIASQQRRSAWVASRPRFRGLGLLICHEARDPLASVVPNRELATQWFEGDGKREDAAQRVAKRLAEIKAGEAK